MLKKSIFKNFGFVSKPKLRILLFHDVAPENMKKLSDILIYLMNSWDFISPDHFCKIIMGEDTLKNDSLLLSFDDGFC